MEALIPILMFGAFISVFIVVAVIVYQREKKRAEAWKALAQSLGLSYAERDLDILNRYGRLKTFSAGHSRQAYNAVSGEASGVRIVLADYRYTTGSGKSRQVHNQTLCLLSGASLELPHAYARPQNFFDFLGKLFGGQDINFDEDADFSAAYVLQGENEERVRKLFDPAVRAWFAERKAKNLHFEAAGDMLLFHFGRRIEPVEARDLMAQGLDLLGRLRE